ncbi:MAG: twin-arginine translocase subunit TatC [Deltaproteobacteria bacterium]|nr:twin-arginine translocase subunit TatC [Deltaproteobacteria bacterium]MBW1953266.1 twin-arginine translocase subunit TatC [Deltaproteobacteria bacterium]MBW1986409.1 twin-arginine translocase subunit TatC [Deltaproteobacteria bacterium]MBW2133804.1 twin-arginine translocase subunit TatC [Deltaproteobacteria bacterium]
MPFLQHLEELRRRLIISLIALIIGMAVAWPFSLSALRVIQRPLTQPSLIKQVHHSLTTLVKEKFPDLAERFNIDPPELAVASRKLNYMAPLEPFFVQMKIALILGIVLSLPVILYQVWLFISPGLHAHEKRYVYLFVPIGTLAFILGDLFFLYLVWPVIVAFSLAYESETLFAMLNLSQYVNFSLRLLLLFGLVFELPLILLVLARIGLVRAEFLARHRRVAILLSAVVAAFHADVMTMIMIALPLYGMYELSIVVVRLLGGPHSRAAGIENPPESTSKHS